MHSKVLITDAPKYSVLQLHPVPRVLFSFIRNDHNREKGAFSLTLHHLCCLALYSQSHRIFLENISLLLAITLLSISPCMVFTMNTIAIPSRIPSLVYIQSQTYSLYYNNVMQSIELLHSPFCSPHQSGFLSFFPGDIISTVIHTSVSNCMPCGVEREVCFAGTISRSSSTHAMC